MCTTASNLDDYFTSCTNPVNGNGYQECWVKKARQVASRVGMSECHAEYVIP